MKLVENGQIVLDGTINKSEKEKIVFREYEKIQQFNEDNELDLFTILKILDNGIANMDGKPLSYSLLLDLDEQCFVSLSNSVYYNARYDCFEEIDNQYSIEKFRFCDYGKTYKEIEK